MKRPLLVGSVTMIALLLAAASLPPDKTKSEEAFDRLESTTDDDVRHHRCAEAAGIFPCSHHRIEIARRLAQYRPDNDPGRQRSFDSRMDLSVQGEEREKDLPIYACSAMSKFTEAA